MEYSIRSSDKKTALGYMGIRMKDLKDKSILDELESAEKLLKEMTDPRGMYLKTEIECHEDRCSIFNGVADLFGKSIRKHLEGCSFAYVICGTLGIQADRLIRSEQFYDMRKAVVLDAVASSAIEDIMDQIMEDIEKGLGEGEYLTDRFAPGYGDLPTSTNDILTRVLDTRRFTGVSSDEGGAMTPSKSVLAIVGVTDKRGMELERNCRNCPLREGCAYKEEDEECTKNLRI